MFHLLQYENIKAISLKENDTDLKERIDSMVNTTNIRIPKKYERYIDEVWSEQDTGDGYWANLIECCICEDTDCHYVHEWTVKDFLKSLQNIDVIDEEVYISHFGTDCLKGYHEDLALLRKEMIV